MGKELLGLTAKIKHPIIRERGCDCFDYRSNLIVDEDNPILIQKAWRDRFSGPSYWQDGKDGGKAYLGVPHGEDAMTWNVFRGLQKEGRKGTKIISDIFKLSEVQRILFWGCDVESQGREQQLLNILIRTTDGQLSGTMTEPDIVLICTDEVAFIECKLNMNGSSSPWKAQRAVQGRESGAEKRMREYRRLGFSEFDKMGKIDDWKEVYQLIRQYVYATLLGNALNKMPVVIPLINGNHKSDLQTFYDIAINHKSCLGKSGIFRDFVTWQDFLEPIEKVGLESGPRIVAHICKALKASEEFQKAQ